MPHLQPFGRAFCLILLTCGLVAADWTEFRGPGGQGTSSQTGLPVQWSADKNVIWRKQLPGAGTSSPVISNGRVFITCYSGYGQDVRRPKLVAGEMKNLRRHLLTLDLKSGNVLWSKEFQPDLPEHKYDGEGAEHGYSSSTPCTDGERLYVFLGKSGVFCFDFEGKQLWHTSVGKGIHGWGSAASPILYKNLLIVNASVESQALVALDKHSGKEIWRTKGINSAWDTPVLVKAPAGDTELVISIQNFLVGLDPDTGKELWRADGVHRYVCPSVVAHDGVVYAIGGGGDSLAVKAGGRGNVDKTHVLWHKKIGSNVPSPIYHQGHLYWAGDHNGIIYCQDAANGKIVHQERLEPSAGRIYASPLLAEGKLYVLSQTNGTYVVAAEPKLKLIAHNVFADDKSRANACFAVSDHHLLLRDDRYVYCLGTQ